MEFMPVCEVLAIIAEKLDVEPDFINRSSFNNDAFQTAFVSFLERNSTQIEWQRKLSLAAQILLRAIYNQNIDKITHWLNFDIENDPANKPKIIEILKIQKSIGSDFSKLCGDTVRNATAGYKAELIRDIKLSPVYPENFLVSEAQLGFDRLQIFQFMRDNDIEYAVERVVELEYPWGIVPETISYEDLSIEKISKPNDHYKKTSYPKLILDTIKNISHDSKCLKVGSGGIIGTKGLVWSELKNQFNSRGAFDYQWKAMKSSGVLIDE